MKYALLAAVAAVFAGLALAALPVGARALPVATIVNSGSTNFGGYTIALDKRGVATVTVDGERTHARIPKTLAAKLFADLAAAPALDTLEVRRCVKSTSFGTVTTIAWLGKQSPDLSCAAGDAGQALFTDAGAIASALKLVPAQRRLPGDGIAPRSMTATPST